MSFDYHCPSCGAGISKGQNYCHNCPAILEWEGETVRAKTATCPKCGAEVLIGDRWCNKCGCTFDWTKGNPADARESSETPRLSYGGGGLGDTIQSAGTAICVILVIISLIGGIALMSTKYLTVVGFVVMAVGCLAAWLTTLLMRGFGQLISDTAKIRALLERQEKK